MHHDVAAKGWTQARRRQQRRRRCEPGRPAAVRPAPLRYRTAAEHGRWPGATWGPGRARGSAWQPAGAPAGRLLPSTVAHSTAELPWTMAALQWRPPAAASAATHHPAAALALPRFLLDETVVE